MTVKYALYFLVFIVVELFIYTKISPGADSLSFPSTFMYAVCAQLYLQN